MADQLTPRIEALLTTERLEKIYGRILSVLARNKMRATFAFVGAFTLEPDALTNFVGRLHNAFVGRRPWLEAFRRAIEREEWDGWLAPEALRLVQAESQHELATHGFTHLPLSEEVTDSDLFSNELGLVTELARQQSWMPHTMVYPRNQVGHVERLPDFGICGYRELLWPQLPLRGTRRRIRELLGELGWATRAQSVPAARTAPVPIPAGYILNFWHNRRRQLIPRAVTRWRWRRLLHAAADTGRVAHLWTHPHNFLSDPGLLDVFDGILREATALHRTGRLINLTQREFSAQVLDRDNDSWQA